MKTTLFFLAAHLEVVGAAMIRENTRLRVAGVSQRASELPKMPQADNPFVPMKEGSKKRVMNAINKFRAEICYRMKVAHGMEFDTFEKCEDFMEKACRPGSDMLMDGDRKEITSGEGYCREFFHEAEEKAKKQIEEEDRAAAEKEQVVAIAPVPAPAPVTPVGIIAPAPATPEISRTSDSPAPAPQATSGSSVSGSSAPGSSVPGSSGTPGSSADAPPQPHFVPGISQGKPKGTLGDDESYYYKKGGKDPFLRMHMNEGLGLPTQGYWGQLVSHDDMETATGDWGAEFKNAGSYESHCRKYCDNEWCIRQGFCTYQRSGASASFDALVLAILAVCPVAFW